jgi:hypothetical protein
MTGRVAYASFEAALKWTYNGSATIAWVLVSIVGVNRIDDWESVQRSTISTRKEYKKSWNLVEQALYGELHIPAAMLVLRVYSVLKQCTMRLFATCWFRLNLFSSFQTAKDSKR